MTEGDIKLIIERYILVGRFEESVDTITKKIVDLHKEHMKVFKVGEITAELEVTAFDQTPLKLKCLDIASMNYPDMTTVKDKYRALINLVNEKPNAASNTNSPA